MITENGIHIGHNFIYICELLSLSLSSITASIWSTLLKTNIVVTDLGFYAYRSCVWLKEKV